MLLFELWEIILLYVFALFVPLAHHLKPPFAFSCWRLNHVLKVTHLPRSIYSPRFRVIPHPPPLCTSVLIHTPIGADQDDSQQHCQTYF